MTTAMLRAAICAAFFVQLGAVSPVATAQDVRTVTPPSAPVRVQLDAMPTGSLVTLLMRDIMRVPYVIAPEVLTDRRPVSVKLVMPRREVPQRIVGFLRGIGLSVRLEGGTVYVGRGSLALGPQTGFPAAPAPASSPLAPAASYSGPPAPVGPPAPPAGVSGSPAPVALAQTDLAQTDLAPVTAIIHPSHRTPGYFAQVLETIAPELAIAARDTIAPQGQGLVPNLEPDRLVISGPAAEIERAVAIVRALDVPRPSVSIRAVVMEVSSSKERGSALSLLASALSGRIGLQSNLGAAAGDQLVRITTGGVQAVLSAVHNDGRFRVVAEPTLLAVSGSEASINAGSQVPTVGAVTFPEDGQPVRSIVYRDSGVTLRVSPVVLPGEIQLAIEQERSSFSVTTTGVNDTPTLNQAAVTANLVLQPGETVALAGLDESSSGKSRSGLLGGLLGVRESSESKSELVLLVQADLAPATPPRPSSVILLGLPDSAGGVGGLPPTQGADAPGSPSAAPADPLASSNNA